jgi:hypothetical protein
MDVPALAGRLLGTLSPAESITKIPSDTTLPKMRGRLLLSTWLSLPPKSVQKSYTKN